LHSFNQETHTEYMTVTN